MTHIKLGFHETDITPDAPMQLIGFGSSSKSQGVERRLRAQVSIWQSDTACCTLVTIDHIGFAVEHAARLRDALGALTGTNAEHVMLSSPTRTPRRTTALSPRTQTSLTRAYWTRRARR